MTRVRMLAALLSATLAAACGDSAGPGDLPNIGIYDYDRTQLLEVEVSGYTGSATTYINQITYTSPAGGVVSGYVGELKAPGDHRPGIVMLHDFPDSSSLDPSLRALINDGGHELVTRGAVVVSIDAPWVRRGELPDFTIQDSVDQVQVVRELRRAIDYLLTRDDVDPDRIGFLGKGYGGSIGAVLAAADRRVKAAALITADGGLVARYTDSSGAPLGALATLSSPARTRWLTAMRPIAPLRYVALMSPAQVLLQSARQDSVVDPADAAVMHASALPPVTTIWYDGGHALPAQAKTDLFAWFATVL